MIFGLKKIFFNYMRPVIFPRIEDIIPEHTFYVKVFLTRSGAGGGEQI
jgi:hypothetical protein